MSSGMSEREAIEDELRAYVANLRTEQVTHFSSLFAELELFQNIFFKTNCRLFPLPLLLSGRATVASLPSHI
jgi:hypothetical protein